MIYDLVFLFLFESLDWILYKELAIFLCILWFITTTFANEILTMISVWSFFSPFNRLVYLTTDMSTLSKLCCPEPLCTFTYLSEQLMDLKTHKAKVHVSLVKALYSEPFKEVLILWLNGKFHCKRCKYSTYPTTIQVRQLFILYDIYDCTVHQRHTKGSCKNVNQTLSPEPLQTMEKHNMCNILGYDRG